jgi:hypothetical protein
MQVPFRNNFTVLEKHHNTCIRGVHTGSKTWISNQLKRGEKTPNIRSLDATFYLVLIILYTYNNIASFGMTINVLLIFDNLCITLCMY